MQTYRVTAPAAGAPVRVFPPSETGPDAVAHIEETGVYFLRVQNVSAAAAELLDDAETKVGEGVPLAGKGETWMHIGGEEHLDALGVGGVAELAVSVSRAGGM